MTFGVFFAGSSGVLLAFFCVIERQKNTRRTPEEPRRTQKEKNTSPPVLFGGRGILSDTGE